MNNIILATDSYKLTHWNQYPKDTEVVYSYFESRPGATYPYTVFFGLQSILKQIEGVVVTEADVNAAAVLATAHFGTGELFNYKGWMHVVNDHGGKLPLHIKAVAEGTVVPTGNVLMTVENTCPQCYWLTNAMESLLTHVWYPSTVATVSRSVKESIAARLDKTADSLDGLPFMLHDFGYRGAATHETAAIGGAAHLVNFLGTDTLPAMLLLLEDYDADLSNLAFSVPATEHSVMTSLGRDGEFTVVQQLLNEHPTGILSIVADSYNIYEFVDQIGTRFKDQIMAREGKVVIRPDSVTSEHPTPGELVVALMKKLEAYFGTTTNSKGFKVLDSHVGLIWGDGIDPHGIDKILNRAMAYGYSAENFVFGMGGGLLQKVNRDTQRFAFKSSAQKRSGVWYDVCKSPLDSSKASKRGRLRLVNIGGEYRTLVANDDELGLLKTVFLNGEVMNKIDLDTVRENAKLDIAITVPS